MVAASCELCQRHTVLKAGYHPLTPITASLPLDHLAIDLAGPLSTTSRGNNYILIVVDVASRFVWLRPLQAKTAAAVAEALLLLFADFGLPRIVQSDNGWEFVNETLARAFHGLGVEHRCSTPYHW